ncbi:hypothetical protein [Falsiroseomonas oryziterrae]|uniref:hypothetical protein n=1 Tax=Falsiroseomonas oryziterrae TaxID=2911368 RepID=UPI001F382588|nr:hypothetical protein [Roseomonas sp. NPKOSM-4]
MHARRQRVLTYADRVERDTKRSQQLWSERNLRRVVWAGLFVFALVFAASNLFLQRDIAYDVAAASTAALAVSLALRFLLR